MGDLDASVAETQRILQAIIAKPKLTEPLLKKPPFRFLHDVVTEVRKVTGFPSALTEHDLDSNNFKDKDSKVAFLTKVITLVTDVVGPIAVKPAKIVAGLEPENTNAWLQGLAKAAAGGGGAPSAPAAAPAKPPREEPAAAAPAPPAAAPRVERPKPKSEDDKEGHADARPNKSHGERTKKRQEEPEAPPPATAEPASPAPKKSAPPPAMQPQQEVEEPTVKRMDRPSTARRAPPRVASNVATKDTRPTSKQSDVRGAVAKVIAEGGDDDGSDDDDDRSFGAVPQGAGGFTGFKMDDGVEHGMLVRNMMQKEQALAARHHEKEGGGMKTDSSVMAESNTERERTVEEMNRLRDAIQSLCQSTNPLARSMDYIQEDLDNMGKELDFWMKDKVAQTQKLEDEERKTEIELEILVSQLRGVEQSIVEEELRINDMKGSVLRNEMTIKQMLGSVVRTN